METPLSTLLGVRTPIMLAGMGGVSSAKLVAEVSNAGGFGTIGAGTISPSKLREEIKKTQLLTNKPIGVDVLAPFTKDYPTVIMKYIDVCAEMGVRAFITGLGIPPEAAQKCKEKGILLACVCGKLAHVKKAVEVGCDFVIVQGTEGGGHTGSLGLMAFLPQAVDLVPKHIPVVAAGGIFDGRGVAAAFAMGAQGVWVGTRFLASKEANTVRGYKEKLVSTETDNGTTISKGYTGKTCRVIANKFTKEWESSGMESKSFKEQRFFALEKGVQHLGGDETTEGVDPEREFMPCGQCVGAIKEILPAKVIFENMEKQALQIMNSWNKSRL